MRCLTFVLSLVLLSCTNHGDDVFDIVFDSCAPLSIALDADVRESERVSVDAGMALWNAAAATALSLEPTALEVVPMHFVASAGFFYGQYDDEKGEITINRDIDDAHERAVTIAHEIGHAFSLRHVPEDERRSLMNPNNVELEPTADDVATLYAAWGDCRTRQQAAAAPMLARAARLQPGPVALSHPR